MMRHVRRPAGAGRGEAGEAFVPLPVAGGGIAVDGDNYGIASTGAYAVNTLIQVRVAGNSAEFGRVAELEARQVPVLGTFREEEPVGRASIIGQVAGELAGGMSVQLYGAAGVGKKAIARAVIRLLSGGPDPVRGIELLPQGGEPHTLGSLYERLAQSFFRGTTFEPPETRLRAAAVASDLAAVVVIGDCELAAKDLTRLLGTFPHCAFLLTSVRRTLYRTGFAHEIGPLGLEAAMELVGQETGHDLAGLRRLQVAEAWKMAGGQAQRLLQFAAFLKFSESRPGQDPLSLVSPPEQAKILASGLSEPARRVLVVLAMFRAELTSEYFAAVTGLPHWPAAGRSLPEAGPELLAAALVTRTAAFPGAAHAGRGRVAYRITPDAAAAVAALGWRPPSAQTAATGLLPLLAGDDPDTPRPSPALLLAVATMLLAAGQDLDASRFIRAAMPAALRAGQVQTWMRLAGLGLQAASAAGAWSDLAYFGQEDATRRQLQGDKIAVAVIAGAELAGGRRGHQAGPHATRHSGSVLRRSARYGAKALSAGHGAAAAAAVLVAAAVVTATVVLVAHSSARSGPASSGAAPPTIAYTTATSVVLRTGTGRPRVLGTFKSGQGPSALAWSWDGKQIAWLTDNSLSIAQVSGGPPRSWACAFCSNIAFQGDQAVTVSRADAGAAQTAEVAVPQLLVFSVRRSAPIKEPITGIPDGGIGTDFILMTDISSNALVVAYGDAGGSDLGGPQLLYRVDSAGHATPYGKASLSDPATPSGTISGALGDESTDSTGDQLGFTAYTRGGACGGVQAAYLLNTGTGTVTIPAIPGGGGPAGFWVQSLWFDRTGTAYASFIPNLSDCGTSPNAPTALQPAHATPVVCKAVGGRWVKTGQGVIHADYAPGGWLAQQTGTLLAGSPEGGYSLTISHGTTTTTISGVSAFAWAP